MELKTQLSKEDATFQRIRNLQATYDCISRQGAINALWKALHEYEDKTEKQFQESEDLDVGDWIEHRIFVQNMNDIDRQTILNMPSVQPEWIPVTEKMPTVGEWVLCQCRANIFEVFKVDSAGYWYKSESRIYMSGFVVAWMPLPEAWDDGRNYDMEFWGDEK